ncbi:hypothetical protein A8938_3742 [Algoriphagus zhangzhouensis]|nr:hypothetical protein A8938_3742 [Algoriphagus zhangzhouensis]
MNYGIGDFINYLMLNLLSCFFKAVSYTSSINTSTN